MHPLSELSRAPARSLQIVVVLVEVGGNGLCKAIDTPGKTRVGNARRRLWMRTEHAQSQPRERKELRQRLHDDQVPGQLPAH